MRLHVHINDPRVAKAISIGLHLLPNSVCTHRLKFLRHAEADAAIKTYRWPYQWGAFFPVGMYMAWRACVRAVGSFTVIHLR